jgi:UDP-GlcNAc:undecaprenyl-phosphate GlcNAc-1-phosphate transferase
MSSNAYLVVFALAFMGCVLVIPVVSRFASWVGAIDCPDQFRRIHRGATPRMGGLGLCFGLMISLLVVALHWDWGGSWPDSAAFWSRQWSVLFAALLILAVGSIDDARGLGPRLKLIAQGTTVLVLYSGGIRIDRIVLLGNSFDFCHPALTVHVLHQSIHPVSMLITLMWFLGCMNVWNLIDGMDGLASGVGVLVSATLMLVAIHQANIGSALMAAALAGSLVGFLLYNWHPAVIFLGDSGSLTVGLLIGVIGIQDSLKGASALSILFPILAMGVPISDTALAIFRRWVRNLPLTAADRRHLHHLLIGLGLTPRQAAVLLYSFTAFLCGVVLLGVAWNSDFLALIVGISGGAAFLLILYSRRDELACLRADFMDRLVRGRQERQGAVAVWQAIQRIELCEDAERVWDNVKATATTLGWAHLRLTCRRANRVLFRHALESGDDRLASHGGGLSGLTVSFRLTMGHDQELFVIFRQSRDSELASDISLRFLQRLALAASERLEWLLMSKTMETAKAEVPVVGNELKVAPSRSVDSPALSSSAAFINVRSWNRNEARNPMDWLRWALGWEV